MKKQLFIENSPFLSRLVIEDNLKESISIKQGKNNTLIVKNIPATVLNRTNQNGRIYSTVEMQKAIDAAKQQIATKQLLCQADEHPEGSFVAPTHASHVITSAYIKKNIKLEVEGEKGTWDVLFCDIEVLNTTEGKNLQALLLSGCSIGTSIRGLGDMDGDQVVNYEFLGFDIVSNPSSGTFTNMPIYEARIESVEDNALNEATKFTVSTYASNTTHDLEQAMEFQNTAATALQYGTITNMNTKMDQEVDPKTGVEKTVGEVEVETSDDTSDLKTALEIAGRAFTNPDNINVTSITIEKVDEDDMKDSVQTDEAVLKEEDPAIAEPDELVEKEMAAGMWIKTQLLDPTAVYYVDEVTDQGVYLIKYSDHGPRIFVETDGSYVFPWEEVKDEDNESAKKEFLDLNVGNNEVEVDGNNNVVNADQDSELEIGLPLPEAQEQWVLAVDCEDGTTAYIRDCRNDENPSDWDVTDQENLKAVFDSEEAANDFKNQVILQGNDAEEYPNLSLIYAKKLDSVEEATDGTIAQDDKTLTIDVDGNEIEKDFRTPEEARVAKAGLENGELTADVMYNEASSYWMLKIDAGDFKDWYVADGEGLDITADENQAKVFPTEEEAKQFQQEMGCEEYEYDNGLRANVVPVQQGITDEDIFGKQEANMDEKLYNQEDPASDSFEQEPVEQAIADEVKDIKVTLGEIVYDIDENSDFDGDPEEVANLLEAHLPETVELQLNGADIPEENAEQFIYEEACKQTGLPIKNATIINIEEIEKDDVKEEDISMDSTVDQFNDETGGLEDVTVSSVSGGNNAEPIDAETAGLV